MKKLILDRKPGPGGRMGLGLLAAVAVACAIAGLHLWQPHAAGQDRAAAQPRPGAEFPWSKALAPAGAESAAPPQARASAPAAAGAASAPSALDGATYARLKADASGNLMIDDGVQDNLERIVALHDREAAQHKLEELAAGLPPAARRQAVDLYIRYQQYATALAQEAVRDEPSTPQEARRQLDALHALRERQLGADTARALYADDEEAARQMIDLMRQQDDPALGLEQKAELAQQAYSKMPRRSKSDTGGTRP